jgi:hypothetical protein
VGSGQWAVGRGCRRLEWAFGLLRREREREFRSWRTSPARQAGPTCGTYGDDSSFQGTKRGRRRAGFRHAGWRISSQAYIYQNGRRISRLSSGPLRRRGRRNDQPRKSHQADDLRSSGHFARTVIVSLEFRYPSVLPGIGGCRLSLSTLSPQ